MSRPGLCASLRWTDDPCCGNEIRTSLQGTKSLLSPSNSKIASRSRGKQSRILHSFLAPFGHFNIPQPINAHLIEIPTFRKQ